MCVHRSNKGAPSHGFYCSDVGFITDVLCLRPVRSRRKRMWLAHPLHGVKAQAASALELLRSQPGAEPPKREPFGRLIARDPVQRKESLAAGAQNRPRSAVERDRV